MIKVNYKELIQDAVTSKHGKISECYSLFRKFSFLNSLKIMRQSKERGIPVGQCKTYKQWKSLGITVKKGQSGLGLLMPIMRKDKEGKVISMFFVEKSLWFNVHQTNTTQDKLEPTKDFDFNKTLDALKIEQVTYELTDGNSQGYAYDNCIAINPIAKYPKKTYFHEVAHILLGHTKEHKMVDNDKTQKNIKEVQAELTALLCCETLEMHDSKVFSIGYVQNWLQGDKLSNKHCQQIISTVNKIFKANVLEKN